MLTPRELIQIPKAPGRISAPRAKKYLHAELDIELEARCDGRLLAVARIHRVFNVNLTVALCYGPPGQRPTPLVRVNGHHGPHGNEDGTEIEGGAHLHVPRPRYMDVTFSKRSDAKHATPLVDMPLTLLAAWDVLRREANIATSREVEEALAGLHDSVRQVPISEFP